MVAGLSQQGGGEPINPKAIKAWLQEEATDGTIDREIAWLFRSGYIATLDGDAYSPTEVGWATLDQYLSDMHAAEREIEAKDSLDEPPTRAKDEDATVLLLIGEWSLKAEAQRTTLRAFRRSSPGSTS